jgi:deoxyribose-phosphate aldolase
MARASHVISFSLNEKWSRIYLNGVILPFEYYINGKMSVIKIASYIDHTLLKPTATHIDINKICNEALVYGFAAVCVPPPLVKVARSLVQTDTPETKTPKVATVIGFPFGYSATKAKLAEVAQAIADGADELDIVVNLVALKEGDWAQLEEEMRVLTALAHGAGKIVKVIIESGILTDGEIIHCCSVYSRVGVDFLKTSTGYAEKGATVAAVRLMREHLPPQVKIKASGGIRDYAFAAALVEAGADRLGCSASVEIVKWIPERSVPEHSEGNERAGARDEAPRSSNERGEARDDASTKF